MKNTNDSPGLITATINKIEDSIISPQDHLEVVLSLSRSEHPNQSLALQISCGPLDSFDGKIPPWFGSQKRRCGHYNQYIDKAE